MVNTVLPSLLIVLMLSSSAFAIDWIIVPGAKVDGDIVCLDRDDVTKEKGVITAWLKRFKEGGNYTKTFVEFDCSQNKSRVIKSIEYDKAQNLTTTVDFEPKWETYAPDTPIRAASKMICKKGKGINPALVSMKVKP